MFNNNFIFLLFVIILIKKQKITIIKKTVEKSLNFKSKMETKIKLRKKHFLIHNS